MVEAAVGLRLEGKVAVLTGSTAGIGYAIAVRLIREGARVVVSSRQQVHVDEAVQSLPRAPHGGGRAAAGVVCHVGHAAQRQNLMDFAMREFGRVDMLVLNVAASTALGPMLDTTEAQWTKMMHTNVVSAVMLAQVAAPVMQSGASLLFVSSIAAFQPMPALAAYSTTKTSLLAVVKALSTELASRNIRVNGLAPGVVATRLSSALVDDSARRKAVLQQIPLGRLGEPHEIAAAAAFCLSNDASYMTGETLTVAGGMPSRL